ncbi:carboxypeptidase [Marinicauda algicola]|uniref:Carboxypeptidase n=1 Tax=Marinicauda algicola TaxID=2029849 RepID=A0A4S2GXQ8_9PROT|nr:M14 family zinc carboxypeptidase [Marinicauda algicola]TGY87937.1 carboxypeptidase [Marinicauda algicola]
MLRFLAAGLATMALTAGASAERYEPKPIETLLARDVRYDAAIPKPEAVTGFAVGEIISTPEMLHAYARAVDAASDRVSVEVIGHSHFGRPILRVTTTSPENQARLEEIRQAHLALSDPQANATVAEDMPVVVQITHGVHGSESSGYDSSAPLLYYLAAAQGAEIEALLDTTVIHQIILINPDGANRFAEYINMHHAERAVADPQHREHTSSWPWGRMNHYWFDLNRQWLPVTQPEAVALVEATHHWQPNVAADLHEMGPDSTFFFSPGPLDGLHPLLSQEALQLNLRMSEVLQRQLDQEGALYVSEEVFDDFYLGYGSSYPGLLGGIPYLFEQSSVRGLIQETEHGTLRYDDKVGQQARTAIALIESSHAHRRELLEHQRAFYRESQRLAAQNPVNAYVFTSHDRGRLAEFLDMLAVHRIEVRELAQPVNAGGVRYAPGEAFVVPLAQPNYRVVEGLFETRIIEEKSAFYDVSGWTQPLAYDLDYAPLRGGLFGGNVAGEPLEGFERAAPAPDESGVAYLLDWNAFHAPRAAYRLLENGLRVRVIPDRIEIETTQGSIELAPGTLIVPVAGQTLSAQEIHALMERAAAEDGVRVHAAATSYTATGSDLGGFNVAEVERPDILLVTGEAVSAYDAGEMWHLLDHEMHMHVSMIDAGDLARADLSRYSHILLPDGRYDALAEPLKTALGDWVSEGGVLIATRGGAVFAAEQGLSSAELVDAAEAPETEGEEPVRDPLDYSEIELWEVEHDISGALLAAEIDISHPLGFGYRDEALPVHKIGTRAFALSDNRFAAPLRYAERDLLLSGYASERNREGLAGQGAVHVQRKGRGSVILFADNPYFRAYMLGSSKMLMNAIFFGNDFRDPSRRE